MITITGHSDDIISISGDIEEEFNVILDNDERAYVVVSDGSVFSVRFDQDGIWRISLFSRGSSSTTFTKVEGSADEGTNDVVTLPGTIYWVGLAYNVTRRV